MRPPRPGPETASTPESEATLPFGPEVRAVGSPASLQGAELRQGEAASSASVGRDSVAGFPAGRGATFL